MKQWWLLLLCTAHAIQGMDDNFTTNITNPSEDLGNIIAPVVGSVVAACVVAFVLATCYCRKKAPSVQRPLQNQNNTTVPPYGASGADGQQQTAPPVLTPSILPLQDDFSVNPPKNSDDADTFM